MLTRLNEISDRLDGYEKRMTCNKFQNILVQALRKAIQAGLQGNYPVGAIITDAEFNVLAQGKNTVFKPHFHSEGHAEMNAITEYEGKHRNGPREVLASVSHDPPIDRPMPGVAFTIRLRSGKSKKLRRN
jgi:hypothetical protein